MTPKELQNYLNEIIACKDAIKWCEGKTLKQAWDECTNPNWMFWFIENSKTQVADKQLRLIAVKYARQIQHLMTDQRSINALDVAERYANGDATDDELIAAWDAARAAARTAGDAWSAARDAARDARDAARAAARDARDARDAQCNIIRDFIPEIQIKEPA